MEDTIGAFIKQLRIKQGWSQAELARKVGISQSVIGQYEVGKRNPKAETLKKLAEVFDCDINIFLAYKAGLTSAPAFDYHDLQEHLDTCHQFEKISHTVNYLSAFGFEFTEKIEFENEVFSRIICDECATFSSNINTNKFSESDIIKLIHSSDCIPSHMVEIQYKDDTYKINYCDYIRWMEHFAEESYILAAVQLRNLSSSNLLYDDITREIKNKEKKPS